MKRAIVFLVLVACDPQKPDWGFEAIDSMKTPADPSTSCGVVIAPDPVAASRRAGCAFTAGALATDSLGLDAKTLSAIPIRHVIVLMKENRSFDHLFGALANVDVAPATYSNPDSNGNAVFPMHATTTCIPFDPNHQSSSVAVCIDGGKMDGFVRNAAATTASDGSWAMSFYEPADLPFDYFLAQTYAISDRHFAPMASGTFGNRDFFMFGTNAGIVDTGVSYPAPTTPSIFRSLMNAGFTWAAYTDSGPLSDALDWSSTDPGVRTMQNLFDDLDHGTLPNVAFVDGRENIEDDHPLADLQVGEAWLKQIYDHALTSPEWQRLAMIWTYDEAGAFADHVAPPSACLALPSSPFTDMGPRIPLVVISPWAKRAYASHVVHDHTAITRFIEALFALPALTARDANSDALLDMFDFSCGRDLSVPPAPAAGTGGCP